MRRWLLLLLVLSVAPVAAQEKKLPDLWYVHIDEVEPARARDFGDLALQQATRRVAIYRRYGISGTPRYEIEFTGYRFVTIVPKVTPPALPDEVKQKLKTEVQVLDDGIHRDLRTHYNHDWYLEGQPAPVTSSAAPRYVLVWSDIVRPASAEAYNQAIAQLAVAAARLHLPSFVRFYDNATGARLVIWCAPSLADLAQVASPGELLLRAFGPADGQKLADSWRESLVSSSSEQGVIRYDLAGVSTPTDFLGVATSPPAPPNPSPPVR